MTLRTLVGKVSCISTLEAGDLVQGFEPPRVTVSSTHWVHPVVGLGVRHEGLARLVALLVFQFLGHLVTVTHLERLFRYQVISTIGLDHITLLYREKLTLCPTSPQ